MTLLGAADQERGGHDEFQHRGGDPFRRGLPSLESGRACLTRVGPVGREVKLIASSLGPAVRASIGMIRTRSGGPPAVRALGTIPGLPLGCLPWCSRRVGLVAVLRLAERTGAGRRGWRRRRFGVFGHQAPINRTVRITMVAAKSARQAIWMNARRSILFLFAVYASL